MLRVWDARHEIRFSERQNTPSGVLLRIVLRVDRRELSARPWHPSLLLRSRLLSRPLSARSLRTRAMREGIMTIIEVSNQSVSAARRARHLCNHCGGPFGLVTHRWWGSKFCKRRCKEAHIREIMLDRRTIHRWCGLLASISLG